MTARPKKHRIGIDLGGSKISGIRLDGTGNTVDHLRIATPSNDYRATCLTIQSLIARLEPDTQTHPATIGVGIPGSRSPKTGLVRNANSTCLNGKDLKSDLERLLARPIRIANDADCFAISEATDGAGHGQRSLWGIILGTGCGSGVVVNGTLHTGPLSIAGEWGHNPLPWPTDDEQKTAAQCWCGRTGCVETWVSGPGMSRDHKQTTGETLSVPEICAKADAGDNPSQATLERHLSRLARGMAHVINFLDPAVIVIGGGLGQMPHLFSDLPSKIAPYIFSDHVAVDVRPPRWGDDSGVRGAAWLWSETSD